LSAIVQFFGIPFAADSGANCVNDALAAKYNVQACKNCWLQGMISVLRSGQTSHHQNGIVQNEVKFVKVKVKQFLYSPGQVLGV